MKKIIFVTSFALAFFCFSLKQSYTMDMTGRRFNVDYLFDRTLSESVSEKMTCLHKKMKCLWKLFKGTCSWSWFVSKCLGEYFCLLSEEYVSDMIGEESDPVPSFLLFMFKKYFDSLPKPTEEELEKQKKELEKLMEELLKRMKEKKANNPPVLTN